MHTKKCLGCDVMSALAGLPGFAGADLEIGHDRPCAASNDKEKSTCRLGAAKDKVMMGPVSA